MSLTRSELLLFQDSPPYSTAGIWIVRRLFIRDGVAALSEVGRFPQRHNAEIFLKASEASQP